MKQITIRELVRKPGQIGEWIPFELLRDGEVIAIVFSPNDVKQRSESNTMSNKLTELPFSKKRQAGSAW